MRVILFLIMMSGALNEMLPHPIDHNPSDEAYEAALNVLQTLHVNGLKHESRDDIVAFVHYVEEDPYWKNHYQWIGKHTNSKITPFHAAVLYIKKTKESISFRKMHNYSACDRMAIGFLCGLIFAAAAGSLSPLLSTYINE